MRATLPSVKRPQGQQAAAHYYASWGRRLGASLLDSIFMFVPLIVIVIVIVALALALGNPDDEDDSSWGVVGIAYFASIVLPFFYYTIFHGRASGQTPAKRMLGIRVADERGESIGYGRAFGRYAITVIFAILLFIPLLLDYLWAALGHEEPGAARQGRRQRRRQDLEPSLGPTIVVVRPVRPSMRRTRCVSNSLT